MDTAILVEDAIDGGAALLAGMARIGLSVDVAFWAFLPESENRSDYLYVASPVVDTLGPRGASLAAYPAVAHVPYGLISHGDYRLISPSEPSARAAAAIRDRRPAWLPVRYRGDRLGDLVIREAYIYPRSHGSMTPEAVVQTVAALLGRSGVVGPSAVTLRGGASFSAVPVRLQAGDGCPEVVFRDSLTGVEKTVRADDVAGIL